MPQLTVESQPVPCLYSSRMVSRPQWPSTVVPGYAGRRLFWSPRALVTTWFAVIAVAVHQFLLRAVVYG